MWRRWGWKMSPLPEIGWARKVCSPTPPSLAACAPPAWYNGGRLKPPDGSRPAVSRIAPAAICPGLPDAGHTRRRGGHRAGSLAALARCGRRGDPCAEVVPHHDRGAAGTGRAEGRLPQARDLCGILVARTSGGARRNAAGGDGGVIEAGLSAHTGNALAR